MYRQEQNQKQVILRVLGEFLYYNIAFCNWIFSICNFVLEDVQMQNKRCLLLHTSEYYKLFSILNEYQVCTLFYVLVMEKKVYDFVSLRENTNGLARCLVLMSTYFGDLLLMEVVVLLWIR